MFDFLKKASTSLFAKLFLAVIIIVFIFWGIGYFGITERDVVAEVNKEKITLREFQEFYHYKYLQLKQAFGELSEEDLKKMKFKELVLQELIQLKLLNQLAQSFGLKVSQEEVEQALLQMPFFQESGRFDVRRYQAFLRELGLKPKTFEELLKGELLRQKLQGVLVSPLLVSKAEAEDFARFMHQKVSYLEAELLYADCEKTITYSERDLENFYLAHRDRYIEDEKIKLLYYEIPFEKEVEVSDEELKNYYLQNLERFRESGQIKLRKIFIPEANENGLKRAQEIRKELKELKDFEKFGVKEGEWFEEGNLPKEFSALLKNVTKGQILGPLKVSQGYLILGVEEITRERVLKLEEVREKLLEELKKLKGREKALSMANELYTKVVTEGGLKNLASKLNLPLRETPYLTLDELSKIFLSREIATKIFKQGKGDYFTPLEGRDSFYLVEILDKKPKRNLSYEEAKKKVLEDYLKEKGEALCENKAEEFLKQVKTEEDFLKVGEKTGFKIRREEKLRKDLPEGLKQLIKPGLLKEPLKKEKALKIYYITQITNSQETPSLEEISLYQKELLEWKREFVLKRFLEDFQKGAKIKIYPLFQQI